MRYSINPKAIGVVADIEGLTLSSDDIDFLQQPEISGLIFFARNYESPAQIAELSASINAIRPDLLLADSSDRKSTRLNSSHVRISYAVFCLKKKNKRQRNHPVPLTRLDRQRARPTS